MKRIACRETLREVDRAWRTMEAKRHCERLEKESERERLRLRETERLPEEREIDRYRMERRSTGKNSETG